MFPSLILLLALHLFLRILSEFLPHERLARDFEWFRHNLAFSDPTKDVLISAVKLAVTLSISSSTLGHHHACIKELFSGTLGEVPGKKVKLTLKENVVPFNSRLYSVPRPFEAMVKKA